MLYIMSNDISVGALKILNYDFLLFFIKPKKVGSSIQSALQDLRTVVRSFQAPLESLVYFQ